MKMVDDLSYVGLLLHLLSDVPLEGDLAGVVFLLAGLLEQGADPAGDALLVSQCLLEDLDDTAATPKLESSARPPSLPVANLPLPRRICRVDQQQQRHGQQAGDG